MKNNAESNARKALFGLNGWFDENWTNDEKEMVKKLYNYLNDNFNPGDGLKWNVIVVNTEEFNYVDPTLIRKSKGGKTVLADYGRLMRPFRCDENYFAKIKYLQCIRIKGKHIHWSLNWGTPQFWDSHEYDEYVIGPNDSIIPLPHHGPTFIG